MIEFGDEVRIGFFVVDNCIVFLCEILKYELWIWLEYVFVGLFECGRC